MLYLQKKNLKKLSKNISHTKVEYHCHYTGKYRDAGHSTCNLKFNTPNKIPIVFYKGSNYDYHFIINVLTISYKIFFLIVEDLWQVHCQILLIILQKEFIKLNLKIVIVFLNMNVLRTI